MSSLKEYQINIKNFIGETPCDGYYILTGLTQDISSSDYINGVETLTPISTGYTFNLIIDDTISHIFLFIEHCDGSIVPVPNPTPKSQGSYQISFVDLTCNYCNFPT
jgi:hypothetical protein